MDIEKKGYQIPTISREVLWLWSWNNLGHNLYAHGRVRRVIIGKERQITELENLKSINIKAEPTWKNVYITNRQITVKVE